MTATDVVITYALLSGGMSVLLTLFTLFFERNKKRSRHLLIWSALFLAASFAATESAFWMEGRNLFEFTFSNFPILSFFLIWFGFYIWVFETRGERKVWVILMIALIVMVAAAMSCMDCIVF